MNTSTKASVTYATVVAGNVADVRAVVADPHWHRWVPFLKSSRCEGAEVGQTRVCEMDMPGSPMDGLELQETILENDSDRGVFSFTIDNPPLPVSNLVGTVTVETTALGPLVSWTSTFEVGEEALAEVRGIMTATYQGALAGLARFMTETHQA